MQIYIHQYELKRTQTANAVTDNSVQLGALIKVMDSEGHFGVADLCPWPSLGDLTLNEELQVRGKLFQHALCLAQLDLQARKNKVKLNQQVPVKNHFTITDYRQMDITKYKNSTVKIKGDQKIEELAQFLNKNSSYFFKVRLDFNGCLSPELFNNFCQKLNETSLQKIECVEDPYHENVVVNDRIQLASDFINSSAWPLKVIKPSRRSVHGNFVYLTSSMDHPVGLAHGLIEAQKYPDQIHGFLTLYFYQSTDFHMAFYQNQDVLTYQSEGYGIGFDQELAKLKWQLLVDFKPNNENQIILAPDLSASERLELTALAENFKGDVSPNGYLLIPSSGSSKTISESRKVYAIRTQSFLNSAARVNQTYSLDQSMSWGCLIPTYHVGGLSIMARSFLSGASVHFTDWKSFSIDWIVKNKIQLLSLVPTQLFDLIQKNISAPSILKHVFIGGGHLSQALYEKAQQLGWPVVATFGMTETSSMFAQRKVGSDFYIPFKNVEIDRDNQDCLKVKCDSLAEYVLQKRHGNIEIKPILSEGWYTSSDKVDIESGQFKFKARLDEEIKVKGFGVSLLKLREQLDAIVLKLNLNILNYALISVYSERQGEELLLVSDFNDIKILSAVMSEFNQHVLLHEKINKFFILQTVMPKTELNKIKYAELKQQVMEEYRG